MNTVRLPVLTKRNKSEARALILEEDILPAASRFVVLIPNGDFNDLELSRKIGKLGSLGKKNILFLGLASNPLQDSILRRRLASLTAYARSSGGDINHQLVFRANWQETLQELLVDGDLIVCLEDHFVPGRLWREVRLAQQLTASVEAPVCMIRGIRLAAVQPGEPGAFRELLVWAANLLTLILFLIVQIRLTLANPGETGIILAMVSVVVELAVLLLINGLF